ncbi:MAG: M20/M25/M40 family metallo-hydrolase [Polyangiaceae bacterium]|nr:M20/M25/M40 family metallo-hydrolase [Polyangiaceae bacterium]
MSDAAAKWISEQSKHLETALAELVAINSFTENVEGGRKVGRALEELFAAAGLSGERIASTKFADHLVFSTAGAPGLPRIALLGHLDTAFPPGTFEGYRRDGDLGRGPGVLDMKGGLVVIVWALKALAHEGLLSKLPQIRVILVADEEVGSPEGQGVIRTAAHGARAALVFEAGRQGDLIITRRKGVGAMTAISHGKAAHAGSTQADGANAVWAIAKFVDRAQELPECVRGVSVNVGRIQGGTSQNTVPDYAKAWVDFRFESLEDGEALVTLLKQTANEGAMMVPGTSIELQGGIVRLPLERSDANVALMRAYGQAARASGLADGEAGLVGGSSDASTTSAMGIASIDGLGPRGTGFHTQDEQIELATLVQKAQALARFLTSLRA